MTRRPHSRPCALVAALLAACVLVGASFPGQAVAAEPEPMTTALIPSFKVEATNGFTGFMFAVIRPTTGKGAMVLTLSRGGESAAYQVPARLTGSELEASFGKLGEIAVTAVPSGHPTTTTSECGGRGKSEPIETGRWDGTIRFRGEEGFASIDATSANEDPAPFMDLVCGESESSEGIGGHAPGALLTVKRRVGEERLELTVRKNKRVGPTTVEAQLSERKESMAIDRRIQRFVGSSAFDFQIPPGAATVDPPAPFSGALDFTRHGGPPSLSGNLTVDFPGRAHVPVLGHGKIAASLIRAVLNPMHPF